MTGSDGSVWFGMICGVISMKNPSITPSSQMNFSVWANHYRLVVQSLRSSMKTVTRYWKSSLRQESFTPRFRETCRHRISLALDPSPSQVRIRQIVWPERARFLNGRAVCTRPVVVARYGAVVLGASMVAPRSHHHQLG